MKEFNDMLKRFSVVKMVNTGNVVVLPDWRPNRDVGMLPTYTKQVEQFSESGKTPEAAKFRLLAAMSEYLEDAVEVFIRIYPVIEAHEVRNGEPTHFVGYARLLKLTREDVSR